MLTALATLSSYYCYNLIKLLETHQVTLGFPLPLSALCTGSKASVVCLGANQITLFYLEVDGKRKH